MLINDVDDKLRAANYRRMGLDRKWLAVHPGVTWAHVAIDAVLASRMRMWVGAELTR